MAHFVKLDNNIVVGAIVVSNEDCGGLDWPESEAVGQQFIANLGLNGRWIQTSYNTKGGQHPTGQGFRKNYAGIGWHYDPKGDAFHAPRPYDSWTLNTDTYQWEAPVPMPAWEFGDGSNWAWDEEQQQWVNEAA